MTTRRFRSCPRRPRSSRPSRPCSSGDSRGECTMTAASCRQRRTGGTPRNSSNSRLARFCRRYRTNNTEGSWCPAGNRKLQILAPTRDLRRNVPTNPERLVLFVCICTVCGRGIPMTNDPEKQQVSFSNSSVLYELKVCHYLVFIPGRVLLLPCPSSRCHKADSLSGPEFSIVTKRDARSLPLSDV